MTTLDTRRIGSGARTQDIDKETLCFHSRDAKALVGAARGHVNND